MEFLVVFAAVLGDRPAPVVPVPTAPVVRPASPPPPTVIGPAASTVPAAAMPGPTVATLIAALTAAPDQPALCADDPDDARPINRDALRALLRAPNEPPAAERASNPRPCQPGDHNAAKIGRASCRERV